MSDVLIVDDLAANRRLLRRHLRRMGHESSEVADGPEAIRAIQERLPDLVILDMRMPVMDGYEVLCRLKDDPRLRHIPVIVLTALEDDAGVVRCIERGAEEYIVKPFNPTFLKARIENCLARKLLHDQEERHRQGLERARNEAREIQRRFLPPAMALPGLALAGFNLPAEGTCGDYYDFIPLAGGQVGVAIGDVSGHGLGPALVMAAARGYLRALRPTVSKLAGQLEQLNEFLEADLADDRFMTLFLGIIDRRRRRLDYVSAGHEPPLLYRPTAGTFVELPSTGLPLGMIPGTTYERPTALRLMPDDLLVLTTDGIVEATHPERPGEAFGRQRLRAILQAEREAPVEQIVEAIRCAVDAFCGQPREPQDDITVSVVRVG